MYTIIRSALHTTYLLSITSHIFMYSPEVANRSHEYYFYFENKNTF